jgi:hypothetical protein
MQPGSSGMQAPAPEIGAVVSWPPAGSVRGVTRMQLAVHVVKSPTASLEKMTSSPSAGSSTRLQQANSPLEQSRSHLALEGEEY